MKRVRDIVATVMVFALAWLSVGGAHAQRRRRAPSPAPAGRSAQRPSTTTSAVANGTRGATTPDSRLTGVYRLDTAESDDPRAAAERAASNAPFTFDRDRAVDELTQRLSSPEQLAIQRRGQQIDIASTRAPRTTFDADGRERAEPASDGHTVYTRAVLYGDQLMVTSRGSRDDEYSVSFDPIENGRRMRVTRRIFSDQINQPIVVQSIYLKSSTVARFTIYGEQLPPEPVQTARNPPRPTPGSASRNRPSQSSPPVIRNRPPQQQQPAPDFPARRDEVFVVPNGLQFVGVLNDDLSTRQTREGDRFTLTVRQPAQYDGAIIEGRVSRVDGGGRVAGRAEMTLSFERMTLRDGRSASFDGYIENIRTPGGEDVRVEPESNANVQEGSDQTNRTVQRVAIGAAVGAIIGAIAGGGKGAGIGAAIGAGAGVGSVYIQGRDEMELSRGTELTVRARTPR